MIDPSSDWITTETLTFELDLLVVFLLGPPEDERDGDEEDRLGLLLRFRDAADGRAIMGSRLVFGNRSTARNTYGGGGGARSISGDGSTVE
jgi:hypothetical protein